MYYNRCNQEYEAREYLMQAMPDRLRGFVMFLAEIYTKVTTPQNLPIEKLAEALCVLLKLLMRDPKSLNLNTVVKVLKVSE